MRAGMRILMLFVGVALSGSVIAYPAASAALGAADANGGHLLQMLRFAPRDVQNVEYANFIGLKRAIGAEIASMDDVPFPPESLEGPLTAGQEIGRAWWWDMSTLIPKSRLVGNDRVPTGEWDRLFGFNLFDVDHELRIGDPPTQVSVIDGSLDPATIGERLLARGYTHQSSPLGAAATFYSLADNVSRTPDQATRYTGREFNRAVTAPGLLIAGSDSNAIDGSVRAATGQAQTLADDPEIALLATTMDDPDLLPGTTLLSAMLFSHAMVERVALANAGVLACPDEPVERLRERAQRGPTTPPLMPYSMAGLGYRRGTDLSERYWLFTLLYPDEATAREAGGVLVDRATRYRSHQAGGPLVGTYVDAVLDPVVRTDASGATVSLLLRARPVRLASLFWLWQMRDLGFLGVGQMLDLCSDG